MDRRQNSRISVQLPVQVWGLDAGGRPFSEAALVTNVSTGGIVVEGLRRRMRPGEQLDVRLGNETSQFRVIWVSCTGDLGLQNLKSRSFLPYCVLACSAQTSGAC
ncbi:MAG: hypothetical protein JO159_20725 [Acidobacteria bacterium]|nr:hypothetical protein [Acidobacteriota bacterium]MBV9625610.1 hypothetical protein [Acidobacteriota bacterium]